MAQAQTRAPPELIDDVLREILVRIPPDESAHLAGASLVCKLWRRIIVSDPSFTRRNRELHRTPPLLGFFDSMKNLFVPTAAACPFPRPVVFDSPCWRTLIDRDRLTPALDCRYGRVVLRHIGTPNLVVWDPITGDHEEVPMPQPNIPYMSIYSTMVLCAAAGCDHGDCGRHGGPFLVVFVGIRDGRSAYGCVYSSETRAWRTPASLYLGSGHLVNLKRGALVGDDAYFVVHEDDAILRYNFGRNRLSTIAPPDGYDWNFVLRAADGGSSLGLAAIRDSKLCLWSRKSDPKGVARWAQYGVVELEKLLPVGINYKRARVMCFAEGVGVMFVRVGVSTFMIELKSGRVRKASEHAEVYVLLPFMSFYNPGTHLHHIDSHYYRMNGASQLALNPSSSPSVMGDKPWT